MDLKNEKNDDYGLNQTNLSPSVISKMNNFIDALKFKKSEEEALKIAHIDKKKLKKWLKFAEKGDEDYKVFYISYEKYRFCYMELITKMKIYIKSLMSKKSQKKSLKIAEIDPSTVKKWIRYGERGETPYVDFYDNYKNVKYLNNLDLMKDYIKLINNGYTNKEAFKNLKIPSSKIKRWIKKGQNGNKDYLKFYQTYMQQLKEEQNNISIKPQTENKSTPPKSKKTYHSTHDTIKKCNICGRKVNKNSKEDICKRCLKKQYAVKILQKLLKFIKIETPFKKSDLKRLNLSDMQITDYIWTLQEFNLISENNNKYSIKNKKILDNFAVECGLKPIDIKVENSLKLSKTCKTCGKTLEISKFFTSSKSPDGHEDYCKSCKKLITTASCLKELLNYINCSQEYTKDELEKHFNNPFKLNAIIWALLDEDLLRINYDRNTCSLADEKTCQEFLNKYYQDTPTLNIKQRSPKKEEMKIIINLMSEGKTRQESSAEANIPLNDINTWYDEGKNRLNENSTKFYKKVKELEEYGNNSEKLKIFIDEVKSGRTQSKAASYAKIKLSLIRKWMEMGKKGEKPYVELYDNYNESKTKKIQFYKINSKLTRNEKETIKKMETYLNSLVNGKNDEEALNDANIEVDELKYWFNRGKQKFGKQYTLFYEEIQKIKSGKYEKESIENSIKYSNTILEPLPDEIEEKLIRYSKNTKTGFAWVNKVGKKWVYTKKINKKSFKIDNADLIKLYEDVTDNNLPWGVRDFKKAKKSLKINEKNNIERKKGKAKIYDKLPQKYEKSFKSTKTNKTGIAWVNKVCNNWVYSRMINGKQTVIKNEDITKLFEEVIENGLVWGVRDFKKAKKYLPINDDKIANKKLISSDINITCDTPKRKKVLITINGLIKNNELLKLLNSISEFEKNILKIKTITKQNKMDVLIELKLSSKRVSLFENKMNENGFEVNKK